MWPGTLNLPKLHPVRGSLTAEDGKPERLYSCTSGTQRSESGTAHGHEVRTYARVV